LNNNFSKVSQIADSLLSERNIQLNRETSEYKRLCRELLIADQLIWKTELNRIDENYSGRFSSVETCSEPEDASSELLSKIIEAHIQEHEKVWEGKSVTQAQSSLGKFLEFVGGKSIAGIEKEHARDYKNDLAKHSNGRGGKLTSAFINKHLSYVVTLFNWTKAQGFCNGESPQRQA
jgi:hypothetical protein